MDKPEWYLTQILTWIRDHEEFITNNIQTVIDKMGFGHINARVELMTGLVQLTLEKLYNDLSTVVQLEDIFTHLIDECLGFEKELHQSLGYPSHQPSVLSVLTQAQYFMKWLTMEKKYATEKMDAMMGATGAWDPLDPQGGDELRVTQVADSFLGLLGAIQERYTTLTQPGHRLQFLDLQLDLVDDFRVRLIQLLHEQPDDENLSHVPQILNTLNFISSVLSEWGSSVHYLHLFHYKLQLNNTPLEHGENDSPLDEGTSVFDNTVKLLMRLHDELVSSVSESVVLDTQAKSRSYRNDKWFSMSGPIPKDQMTLSPTACPIFQMLCSRLHSLQNRLATPIFTKVWRKVTALFDSFVYEEVVLQNTFNPGGAAQLQFDMHRNLFPLFAQYTSLPEKYFPKIKESCILLTLSKGSAMLVLESISPSKDGAFDLPETEEALKELGIFNFNMYIVEEILHKRIDLTT